MSPRRDPPATPEGEQPRGGSPLWRPTKQDRESLTSFYGVLAVLTVALALVGPFLHQPVVALVVSAGLVIVASAVLILIRRAISRTIKVRISVMIGSAVIAVLAGVGIGVLIRYVSQSPAHHPLSAPATVNARTEHPATPSPATPSQSSAPPSPSVTTGAVATFTTPTAGTDISDGYLSAAGTVRRLPAGYRLDLFLKVSYLSVYYAAGDPNSALTTVGDRWSGSIFVGSQGPCTVYIELVELSPTSVRLMNSEDSYQSGGYPSVTVLGTTLATVRLNLS